jgi:hypothetical protein
VGGGEGRDPETGEEGAGEESPRGRHGVGWGGMGNKTLTRLSLGWMGLGGGAVETTAGVLVGSVRSSRLWVRFVFGLVLGSRAFRDHSILENFKIVF